MNPNIEIALHDYIQSLIGKPFEFGVNDCPLLCAGALDILTGGNRLESMKGLWHDKKSAWKYMRKNGTISEHLIREGCVNVEENNMQTGDFVLMSRELANEKQWHSVGVCLGSKVAIVSDEDGVIVVKKDILPEIDEVLRWQ